MLLSNCIVMSWIHAVYTSVIWVVSLAIFFYLHKCCPFCCCTYVEAMNCVTFQVMVWTVIT